jgi:hypothetical protein
MVRYKDQMVIKANLLIRTYLQEQNRGSTLVTLSIYQIQIMNTDKATNVLSSKCKAAIEIVNRLKANDRP